MVPSGQGLIDVQESIGRQPGRNAIRAFRAAYELGIGTVAVNPVKDRNSVHRTKADEYYQIGEPGHPVRA